MDFAIDISLKIYDNNPKSLLFHCVGRRGEYEKLVNLESANSLYELKNAKKLVISHELELTNSLNSEETKFAIVDFVEEV